MGIVDDIRPGMPSKRHVARILLVVACLTASLAGPGVATATASEGASPQAETYARSDVTTCGSGVRSTAESAATSADGSGNLLLDTFVAPGADYDRLTDADALATAREAGTLTPASDGVDLTWEDELVAYRDVIVHRIALNGSATGLFDRLAAQERGSVTENFRALAAGDDVEFEYIGATACPPELALNASIERGAFRVVSDRENDALFLVLDTDRLLFHPLGGGDPTTDTFVTGHHGLTLTLRESSGLVARNVTVESHYEVKDARAEFASPHEGLVRVASEANQSIRGRTTLAPGSDVEVSLHPYAANTSVVTAIATVNRSREFVAKFDLENTSPGTTYVAAVTGVTEPPVVQAGATLVAVGNATTALVDASDYNFTRPVSTLYPMAVTTTDGGFVTVRNASGGLLGVSEYLEPGARVTKPELSPRITENQTVTVTVYRDANANREFDDADVPYRANGTVVQDAAVVRPEDGRESVTTTVTTRMTTEKPTTTTVAMQTTTGSPVPGVPGFGVRATVVALAALVLFGVRRRGPCVTDSIRSSLTLRD